MAKIFITGSSDGLGLMAAKLLLAEGHSVVLHARNAARAKQAMEAAPAASGVLVADLASLAQMRDLAEQANALGPFDAVIHNAAVGYQEPRRIETEDGLSQVFAVNSLAPYVLTALMHRPQRLVYISSGLHRGGDESLSDLQWRDRAWNGTQAYSDSKLHDVLLAFAVARRWPDVFSNALEPGWVATKMGGPNAPDDLTQAPQTQAWLAAGTDPGSRVTAGYFYHRQPRDVLPAARDERVQDAFLDACERASGVQLPSGR